MLEQRRLQANKRNRETLLRILKEKQLTQSERQAYLKSLALVEQTIEKLEKKLGVSR